jgi:hypothetical protein
MRHIICLQLTEIFRIFYKDEYAANGLLGSDGIADVLDEAKWGLDWLIKMNPRDDWMFNQLADDRDHHGMRHSERR